MDVIKYIDKLSEKTIDDLLTEAKNQINATLGKGSSFGKSNVDLFVSVNIGMNVPNPTGGISEADLGKMLKQMRTRVEKNYADAVVKQVTNKGYKASWEIKAKDFDLDLSPKGSIIAQIPVLFSFSVNGKGEDELDRSQIIKILKGQASNIEASYNQSIVS